MNELRSKCLELLEQIPDEDLQQVIDEIEGIIKYNEEAASYIPQPQSRIETIPLIITGTYTTKSHWVWDNEDGWCLVHDLVEVKP